MYKRFFSFLLTVAMVLGMLPAGMFASAAQAYTLCVAYGTAVLDGALEEAWTMTGILDEDVRFGALYDGEYLYLGFDAAVSGLSVKLNDKRVNAVINSEGTFTEAKLLLSDAELDLYRYDQTASLEITANGSTWAGTVRFDSATMAAQTLKSESYKGSTSATQIDGGWRVKLDADKTAADTIMNHGLSVRNVSQMDISEGIGVLEFDFKAVQMPSYPEAAINYSSHHIVPGLNALVIYGTNSNYLGYLFGITNIEGKLVLVIRSQSGSSVSKTPARVELGKEVGEQFHLRLEYQMADKSLAVYCDDVLLDTVTNTLHRNTTTTANSSVIMYQAVGNAAYVKDYGSVEMEITNLRAGSPETGSVLDDLTLAETVTGNLPLPNYVENAKLGKVDITWESSDTSIMSHSGTVKPGAKGTVTMTAKVKADPAVTKEFTVNVASDIPLYMNAAFGKEAQKIYSLGDIPFGAAYDAQNLYLQFGAALSDVSIRLSGAAVEAQTNTSGSETKVTVPLTELERYTYDSTATLEIDADGKRWAGTVRFDSAVLNNRAESFASKGSYAGTNTCDVENGAFHFQLNSATCIDKSPSLRYGLGGALAGVSLESGVSVLEFDMCVSKMPVYSAASIQKNWYLVPGMNMTVQCNSTKAYRYTFGISNLEGYGLAIVVAQKTGSTKAAGALWIISF